MIYVFAGGAFALTLAALTILYFKGNGKVRTIFFKVISLMLFAALFVRYFMYNSDLVRFTMKGKDFTVMMPPLIVPEKRGPYVLAMIGEWLSVPAALAMVIMPFSDCPTMKRLRLFAMPVYCALAWVCLGFVASLSMGAEGITAASALFGVECGMTTAYTVYCWIAAAKERKVPFFANYRDAVVFFGALLTVLVISLPTYSMQFFLGETGMRANEILKFRPTHRILLYGAIIIPFAVYYALRHREKESIYTALVFSSLICMFVYCYNTNFHELFSNPSAWPLHLCNTAMFLVPVCLIFRTKRLFYFTYFINVFGAMIAMLMPNYNNAMMIYSHEAVRFWYNHYNAFFMPLLLVALKLFDRPTAKQFRFAILGFVMYFVAVLAINVTFRAFGYTPDYFFLVGDHIADTLGNWAMAIYNITAKFTVGGLEFLFRPVYQSLFFVVYIALGLAMWFVYELFFSLADAHGALVERNKKIKADRLALESVLNGRSIEEPMNADAGIKLELKHFSKRYSTSKAYAVEDANLEVRGGEIFGFLGPNGAGKSTIIKSIVGIQPITEGAIEVCGYDCEKQPVQAKRLIGYVPDHYALYEKLTGREYINYIADIYGVPEKERNERIERHIQMFELAGAIDNPIKTYSHGMKQKITIMAALVHDPKLWILDEPLTGLDPNSIFQVKECMKEHAAKGNIVFFSSHIIDVVERICDRITIIKKGKILVTRDVADIEKEGLLEDFYLRTINGEERK